MICRSREMHHYHFPLASMMINFWKRLLLNRSHITDKSCQKTKADEKSAFIFIFICYKFERNLILLYHQPKINSLFSLFLYRFRASNYRYIDEWQTSDRQNWSTIAFSVHSAVSFSFWIHACTIARSIYSYTLTQNVFRWSQCEKIKKKNR